MRRQDVNRFRRHWLDVHGRLVCAFPRPRAYGQCHVIDSIAANEDGLPARIDGFPIPYFDNDSDRTQAHNSPEMAVCNIDSQHFAGAVSRVIADVAGPLRADPGRFSLIELWPGQPTAQGRSVVYTVREPGAAPNSVIPHWPIVVGAVTQTWFDRLVALERAAADLRDRSAARFVVEEHWLS